MKINWRAIFLTVIILLLFSMMCFQFIKKGLGHSDARRDFAQASESFENGEYSQSLTYSLKGTRNTLESGFRWTFGEPHLIKAQTMLHERKDLYGALDECELAQTIIGSTYDNEGMVSTLCWMIKAEINPDVWQNPTLPVPTKTPKP